VGEALLVSLSSLFKGRRTLRECHARHALTLTDHAGEAEGEEVARHCFLERGKSVSEGGGTREGRECGEGCGGIEV